MARAGRPAEFGAAVPSAGRRGGGRHVSPFGAGGEQQRKQHQRKAAYDGHGPENIHCGAFVFIHRVPRCDLIKGLQGSVGANIAELVAELDDKPVAKAVTPVPVQGLHEMDWVNLQQTVAQCENCDLSRSRQQTVFGDGNRQASWLFVGDVPRLDDEIAGQPMSGESGVLLNNMLRSLGVDKSQVYITSLLKCRTPLDGSPTELQAAACESYLPRQIELIKPEMVVLMGRDTVQRVLGSREPMARLRKKVHRKPGFNAPMVATYHPFYLLSQPRFKAYAWQDLLFAGQAME